MPDPDNGTQEGTGDEPVPSLRFGDDGKLLLPDEWIPLLWEMLNRTTYKQAEDIIRNADLFMEHVQDYWQGEAEAHMERMAEEGWYSR